MASSERKKEWYRANAPRVIARVQNARSKRLYGLSSGCVEDLSAMQEHQCRICSKPREENTHGKLYPDHDHQTKKFRGMLCHKCNVALGAMDDDPERLERAAQYLRFSRIGDGL